ncbi:homeobox protein Hox-C8-like isoform X2 [Hydra vulgaris]|uniref:Homeobox protein Hox-C8-like isoform X2 n=1 Tax=Hydra vulgaris TaxID=6087 RepID=A0ABM4CZR3_HYDVU
MNSANKAVIQNRILNHQQMQQQHIFAKKDILLIPQFDIGNNQKNINCQEENQASLNFCAYSSKEHISQSLYGLQNFENLNDHSLKSTSCPLYNLNKPTFYKQLNTRVAETPVIKNQSIDWNPYGSNLINNSENYLINSDQYWNKDVNDQKRKRISYNCLQIIELENEFMNTPYISRERRLQLSSYLNLTERQIKTWFQNRRMKSKKLAKLFQLHSSRDTCKDETCKDETCNNEPQ